MATLNKWERDSMVDRLGEMRQSSGKKKLNESLLYIQGVFAGLMLGRAVDGHEYCRLMDMAMSVWETRYDELIKKSSEAA